MGSACTLRGVPRWWWHFTLPEFKKSRVVPDEFAPRAKAEEDRKEEILTTIKAQGFDWVFGCSLGKKC